MDLPLAKAEPTSDGDSASGKMNLKREKALKLQMDRGGIIWEKKSTSESMRGSEKGRGGGISGTGAKIPLQPWWSSCAPAARGGSWWSRDPPAACGGLQAGRLTEAVTPWEACTGASTWQDPWPREERTVTLQGFGADLQGRLVTLWGNKPGTTCSWRTALCERDARKSSSWRTAACGKGSLWSLWRTVSNGILRFNCWLGSVQW